MPQFNATLQGVAANDKGIVKVTLEITMGNQTNKEAAVELLMMAGGPVECVIVNPNQSLFEETPKLGEQPLPLGEEVTPEQAHDCESCLGILVVGCAMPEEGDCPTWQPKVEQPIEAQGAESEEDEPAAAETP